MGASHILSRLTLSDFVLMHHYCTPLNECKGRILDFILKPVRQLYFFAKKLNLIHFLFLLPTDFKKFSTCGTLSFAVSSSSVCGSLFQIHLELVSNMKLVSGAYPIWCVHLWKIEITISFVQKKRNCSNCNQRRCTKHLGGVMS